MPVSYRKKTKHNRLKAAGQTDHAEVTLKFKRMLQSKRWQRCRKVFIAANPFCIVCKAESRLTPTQIVDHVKPWRTHPELFWVDTNWQPLCMLHHNQKINTEEGGFGRRQGT